MGSQSQTIGPYTLEKRLGAGGMGEVYQAYDRRLDRWVALKLIRPEYTENVTARERFRREARAAARLSHPSIVQIYDIVESEESDAIILELVEGEPLARRIARGPLPIEEAVRLGRQIAEGLAAAHARGIIHRDLKPENVMVTHEGQAKILDFGLAKRLQGEASLTEDDRVVGTFRSMSPEQARGLPLDQRSDLFSFGILLYEMLSGRSPFAGDSTLDTLTRICHNRQRPLRELNPEATEELSFLVDRLLEKEPVLRPKSAWEVSSQLQAIGGTSGERAVSGGETTWIEGMAPAGELSSERTGSSRGTFGPPASLKPASALRRQVVLSSAVALLLCLFVVLLWRWMSGRDPLYVAVPRPVLATGADAEKIELLSSGLRVALLRSLASLDGISPLSAEQVDSFSGPPSKLARATAAEEIVTSRLDCTADLCNVTLERVRGQDGALMWTYSFKAPVSSPYLLAQAAEARLQEGYRERRRREGASPLNIREADYAEYLRLQRSFEAERSGEVPFQEILQRLEVIHRSSPGFLEPYLLEARVRYARFLSSRDPQDLEGADRALGRARELAPGDARPLSTSVDILLATGKLDRAEEALRKMERLEPGDAFILVNRSRLAERRGQIEEARMQAREAVRRQPSWHTLFFAARLEFGLGNFPAARDYLEKLLESWPGHYTGLSLLGQVELFEGSPQRAVKIYSDLVRRSAGFDELTNLGVACLLLRRYPEAEAHLRRAHALEPKNWGAVLNLADVLLLNGRQPEAVDAYRQVLELIEKDPGWKASWQHLTVRGQALAHLGKALEAVESVQGALRLAPNSPQAAYEASLVYLLVGDRTSALTNALKALEQGIEPVWFDLAWFDPLRASAEFAQARRQRSHGQSRS